MDIIFAVLIIYLLSLQTVFETCCRPCKIFLIAEGCSESFSSQGFPCVLVRGRNPPLVLLRTKTTAICLKIQLNFFLHIVISSIYVEVSVISNSQMFLLNCFMFSKGFSLLDVFCALSTLASPYVVLHGIQVLSNNIFLWHFVSLVFFIYVESSYSI